MQILLNVIIPGAMQMDLLLHVNLAERVLVFVLQDWSGIHSRRTWQVVARHRHLSAAACALELGVPACSLTDSGKQPAGSTTHDCTILTQ